MLKVGDFLNVKQARLQWDVELKMDNEWKPIKLAALGPTHLIVLT